MPTPFRGNRVSEVRRGSNASISSRHCIDCHSDTTRGRFQAFVPGHSMSVQLSRECRPIRRSTQETGAEFALCRHAESCSRVYGIRKDHKTASFGVLWATLLLRFMDTCPATRRQQMDPCSGIHLQPCAIAGAHHGTTIAARVASGDGNPYTVSPDHRDDRRIRQKETFGAGR